MGAFRAEDERTQSSIVEMTVFGSFRYALTDSLYVRALPAGRFQSGSTQAYVDESRAESRLYLGEASVNWSPVEPAFIQAGALRQADYHSPLLIGSGRAFPALRARISEARTGIYLDAQAAVPTSQALASNTAEKEDLPTLASFGVGVSGEWRNRLRMDSSLRRFRFSTLPSNVAERSIIGGNSVEALSATDNFFIYGFAGTELRTRLGFSVLGPDQTHLDFTYLINEEAPEQLNQAYSLGVLSRLSVAPSWDILGSASYFRIEPDAAVSFYNASRFGLNNRQGYRIGFAVDLFSSQTRIGLDLIESQVLYTDPFQTRQTEVLLTLETLSDLI